MLDILFRHHDFVAVNKPQGLCVQGGDGSDGLTSMLATQLNLPRVWLVHRLDKPTSGVLLLALNEKAAFVLAQQFAAKTMRKTYIALSDRKPLKKQGWVKGGMEKARRGAWKLTRNMEKPAVTRFYSHSISPNLRLFVLEPHTGKTHQLRVAMKSLGSPIWGDALYGGTPAERLFLHASNLSFDYGGTHFDITAPPDEAWLQAVPDWEEFVPQNCRLTI
ncbi:TIGR01621 family pseudouridine synthase [Neisseria animaloris]|uniref:TIGR01621 family pseudouridine synthase n=1 Tax=Neisseria animaloris TaxID=326522 RepID=UPI000D3180BA|nr:TIGR01621 family pseudouridine synthase [Neisseria animaloris]